MPFNNYIWNLYKTSEEGKKFIEECEPANEFPNDDECCFPYDKKKLGELPSKGFAKYIFGDQVNLQQIYLDFFKDKNLKNFDDIDNTLLNWAKEGIVINEFEFIAPGDYAHWLDEIELISNTLYTHYPDYFFPYFFTCNFNKFQEICSTYNIPLPDLPKKKDKKERLLYYLQICSSLNEFRQNNNMEPQELVAFFYDFALKALNLEMDDYLSSLPNASKVWYVGAGRDDFEFLDNAKEDASSHWQCHIDTKPGDIILVYCWTPRSYIHSVWRATTEGFYDPFFYYFRLAYISKPIKVPPITYKEIISNPILSTTPLANNRFQGVNGYPVSFSEYEEMIRLWKSKGMDVSILPRLEKINILPENVNLYNERDIEIYLVEPFLKKLGFKESDWIRQMPIKMGRGIRYYPDYCFGANDKRGEEKAKMILEAKYSITNSKELKDAYYQAKSYALRLQAHCFILAAKEGLWVYFENQSKFKLDNAENYSWDELSDCDLFHKIKLKIQKL